MESNLYQGILEDARNHATSIIKDAEQQAERRKVQSKKEIDEALSNQKEAYERNLKSLEMRYESLERSLLRRKRLKRQSSIANAVLSEVKKEFKKLPLRDDYEEIMVLWIAEGAMGIACNQAIVSYGKNDKITEDILRNAENRVKRITGKEVKLQLGFNGFEENGVIVSSKDGRISFNNQVSSRLRRFSREINEFVEGLACKIE